MKPEIPSRDIRTGKSKTFDHKLNLYLDFASSNVVEKRCDLIGADVVWWHKWREIVLVRAGVKDEQTGHR